MSNSYDFPWLRDAGVQALIAVLAENNHTIRAVGGCVRDFLLGQNPKDVDFACNATPQEMQAIFDKAGIRTLDKGGLEHGTVIAVINNTEYEITTLRKDVATDGRHATVPFGADWHEDSARRDLTINAIYANPDGTLYNPQGGIADLAVGNVRFIGDPVQRIEEDALRMYRFFRFAARYQNPDHEFDPHGVAACAALSALIDIKVSGEKLYEETQKFFKTPLNASSLRALQVMHEIGLYEKIFMTTEFDADALVHLAMLEHATGQTHTPLRSVAVMAGQEHSLASALNAHWKLSREDAKRLTVMTHNTPHSDPAKIDYASLDQLSLQNYTDRLLVAAARQGTAPEQIAEHLAVAQEKKAIAFPIMGEDLLALGFRQGKQLGDTLKGLRTAWIESELTASREDLLMVLNQTMQTAVSEKVPG